MDSVIKNKIIISTRASGKSKELGDILLAQGATLFELPMIEITQSDHREEIIKTIHHLQKYTHIAFTSANGFRFFYDEISKIPNYLEIIHRLKIVSIGYNTSACIKATGFNIYFDAEAKTGEEFTDRLAEYLIKKETNAKILWPTGNLSPNYLVKQVSKIALISRLNIYKNIVVGNVDPKLLNIIEIGEYDMIIVASPSAFENLYSFVTNKKLKITCIGKTTANAVLNKGIEPLAIAEEPNSRGIYNALCNYYSKNLLTK